MIDTIVGMVNNRFQDVDSFSFLDLVNPKLFTKWQSGVPADKLQLLREKYGPLFDISSLESQLMFIYKDQDFLKDSPMELLQYIYQMNIQGCIPEFVKLLKLNAVIAVSSASAERSFSCFMHVSSPIFAAQRVMDDLAHYTGYLSIRTYLRRKKIRSSSTSWFWRSLLKSQDVLIFNLGKYCIYLN